MNSTAVNLGAGGFVSYFEDGGASVNLDGYLDDDYEEDPYQSVEQDFVPEMDYVEQGVGSIISSSLNKPQTGMATVGRGAASSVASSPAQRRLSAVGTSMFKLAGMQGSPMELTEQVDKRIFAQLSTILGRKLDQ